MLLLDRQTLDDYGNKYPGARPHINSWILVVQEAHWTTPMEMKEEFPSAKILGKQQVVFKIEGNRHRLLVKIAYKTGTILVKKIGTHKEYDKWEFK